MTDEELTSFHLLPSAERLNQVDEFARSLTVGEVWGPLGPQDKAYMAEIRCIISDAVYHARTLDYAEANRAAQRAMRRLVHVRTRPRQGKWHPLPADASAALVDATNILTEIIALFLDAESHLASNQGVLV